MTGSDVAQVLVAAGALGIGRPIGDANHGLRVPARSATDVRMGGHERRPLGISADEFVDGAYATVKGQVRTYVLHQQLMEPPSHAPAALLDVGAGGHQSFPARVGYEVTRSIPLRRCLAKADQRLAREAPEVRSRVRLVQASGEDAAAATGGQRFGAVLCHGVLCTSRILTR